MRKNKKLKQAKQSLQSIKGKIKDKKNEIKSKIEQRLEEKKINIAIVLTLTRAILALIVVMALLFGKVKTAIALFIIAGLTDILDGYFARKEKQETFFGQVLDPIADKLLINLTALALVVKFGFPLWALAVFLIKDLGILIVGGYVLLTNIKRIIKPTIFAKATTVIQIIAIIIFFLGTKMAFFDKIRLGSIFIACFFTLYTGIDYLIRFYKQKPKKVEEFHFKVLLKLPDYITLLNAFCGVVAIFLAFYKIFPYSCIFMLMSVVFDYFDGKIARKIGREGSFGKELDSLTDILSFGVAPAIFGISLLHDNINSYFEIIVIFVFLVCGILRLARYNVIEEKGIYYGMPITFNVVVISLFYFFSLWFSFILSYLPYVYLILGLLMISPFKIKKKI